MTSRNSGRNGVYFMFVDVVRVETRAPRTGRAARADTMFCVRGSAQDHEKQVVLWAEAPGMLRITV